MKTTIQVHDQPPRRGDGSSPVHPAFLDSPGGEPSPPPLGLKGHLDQSHQIQVNPSNSNQFADKVDPGGTTGLSRRTSHPALWPADSLPLTVDRRLRSVDRGTCTVGCGPWTVDPGAPEKLQLISSSCTPLHPVPPNCSSRVLSFYCNFANSAAKAKPPPQPTNCQTKLMHRAHPPRLSPTNYSALIILPVRRQPFCAPQSPPGNPLVTHR